MPPWLRTLNGRPRPHLLYMHTEKTGGSTIECATEGQDMVNQGVFTNLGHTNKVVVDGCKESCSHKGVLAQTVISIREPYSWWRSLYTYGYVCKKAAVCTKKDFIGFMRSASPRMAQGRLIDRACGTPCTADH